MYSFTFGLIKQFASQSRRHSSLQVCPTDGRVRQAARHCHESATSPMKNYWLGNSSKIISSLKSTTESITRWWSVSRMWNKRNKDIVNLQLSARQNRNASTSFTCRFPNYSIPNPPFQATDNGGAIIHFFSCNKLMESKLRWNFPLFSVFCNIGLLLTQNEDFFLLTECLLIESCVYLHDSDTSAE